MKKEDKESMLMFKAIGIGGSLWMYMLGMFIWILSCLVVAFRMIPKWIAGYSSVVDKLSCIFAGAVFIPLTIETLYQYPIFRIECVKDSVTIKNILGRTLMCYEIEDKVNIGIAAKSGKLLKKNFYIYITGKQLSDVAIRDLIDCYEELYAGDVFCFKYDKKNLEALKEFYHCEIKGEELIDFIGGKK